MKLVTDAKIKLSKPTWEVYKHQQYLSPAEKDLGRVKMFVTALLFFRFVLFGYQLIYNEAPLFKKKSIMTEIHPELTKI